MDKTEAGVLTFFGLILFIALFENTQCLHHLPCKKNHTDPKKISVVLLLPKDNFYLASYNKVAPVINFTMKRIQERGLLRGMDFELEYRDTGCDLGYGVWESIKSFVELPLNVYLGPLCDYIVAPVARLLKFMHVPMITAGALAYDFNAKDRRANDSEYHMLVRTGWTFDGMAKTLKGIFQKFNWLKLLLLYEMNGRPEVMKDHYCALAMQALNEVISVWKNFTLHMHKLTPDLITEDAIKVAKDVIGAEYGGKHILKLIFSRILLLMIYD
ncbi:atrial natriuretic peptide receptor 3-like [Stegodyphus dumicola]|uniref:atrial natriuretic peptide receptor 3-like n=1 Tax=Stegodyphus dumicola TaxID=202533 RepID=UPI0015B07D54|nr:atrial natriuretic peptide receptor 3-like [Stegodyphus dumicola]